MSKCVICENLATTEYEGQNSCGKPSCDYQIQEGLDFIADHANGVDGA